MPTYPEHLAAVSYSGNSRGEVVRRDDSRSSGCLVRDRPPTPRRIGHRPASPRGESEPRTVGEMEAAIGREVARFEQVFMGRGPEDVRVRLLGDLLVVRLQGVLTASERRLVESLSGEKGRDLLKQVRTHLIETARPAMEAIVRKVTGLNVRSMHHDISTVTGEEVVLFTLVESPDGRDAKRK